MKQLALFSILVVASATVCAADKTPKTIHCAVTPSETVNIADATKHHMYADYKGRRYFFCCNGCPQDFKKNPAKYAKHESIPTPKTTKPVKPAKKG